MGLNMEGSDHFYYICALRSSEKKTSQAFNKTIMADQDYDNLREKLNSMHTWPSVYLFKFIVKNEAQQTQILGLFNVTADQVRVKASSKGTYHSISIYKEAHDAEEIINLYKATSVIEGVIAL